MFSVFLVSSQSVVHWDPQQRLFVVRSGLREIFVARRERLFRYAVGIEARMNELEREYCFESWRDVQFGDFAIDVGANIGEVTLQLREIVPRVLAFEPDPTEFVALVANLKGSAGCVPNAVSDHDGEVTFFLANETGDSSLLQPSAQHHRKN